MDYLCKADRVSQLLHDSLGLQCIRVWFFFDFRADRGTANSFEGLLRSLLLQLLEQVPDMEPELRQLRNKIQMSESVPAWNKRSLREAFHKALATISSRVYIFTDGLDEYSGNMPELLAFFQGLSESSSTGGRLKICLASRPQPVIDLALKTCPGFRMQDQNFKGIEQYVSRTVVGLVVATIDQHRIKRLGADVAESAEGVFLWARFAVPEVITSYAEGDSPDELKRRLGELPSEMEGIYARIFGKMSTKDRHEARLMFQLVCFARDLYQKNALTILQLKEAFVVAENLPDDATYGDGVDTFEGFRKRVRARCGGLLEEVPRTRTEVGIDWTAPIFRPSDDIEDDNHDGDDGDDGDDDGDGDDGDIDPKGWHIKLIHRTVESYLEREGWLSGWQIENEGFASPFALWLFICCRCVKSLLGPYASRLPYSKPKKSPAKDFMAPSLKYSLINYAAWNLFGYASLIERLYQESSYRYLSRVPLPLWRYLQSNNRLPKLRFSEVSVDWDAVDEGSDRQPWQIVVEQGLALCSWDVIEKNLYKPLGNGQDISLALHHLRDAIWKSTTFQSSDNEQVNQLIRVLLQSGSIVSERNILECLYDGSASTLKLLLHPWPQGAIRLNRGSMFFSDLHPDILDNTYNGEAVGPLWELARSDQQGDDFEGMLDFLLERGEKLNQSCGPGGTMLHGVVVSIIEEDYTLSLERVKLLLDRRVNINVRMLWGDSFLISVSFPFVRHLCEGKRGCIPYSS